MTTFCLIVAAIAYAVWQLSPLVPEWREPLIIPTGEENVTNAVLLYMPGFAEPAEAYGPFMKQIQREFAAHNMSLHVSILRYPKLLGKEFPPFLGKYTLVTRELQRLPSKDLVPLFLGGHSLGSILTQMTAYRYPIFDGLLVHGAYVRRKYRNKPLPVPTLTLSGTRDGMNRLTHIAMQHMDLRELYSSGEEYGREAPSLLIEGMNHMQLAAYYNVIPYHKKQDLEATISMESAVEQAAEYSALFMLQRMNVTLNNVTRFKHQMKRSEDRYFRPYIQAVTDDAAGETCVVAQRLQLETKDIEIASHRRSKLAFAFTEPLRNETSVEVAAVAGKAFTIFERSSTPPGIQTLRCKMISKANAFGEALRQFDTCASINKAIFQSVLNSLPGDIQASFSNATTKVDFGDDLEITTKSSWLWRNVEIPPPRKGVVRIQSPKFETVTVSGGCSGSVYCALLSKSRAYEYIMIDVFRKAMSDKEGAARPG